MRASLVSVLFFLLFPFFNINIAEAQYWFYKAGGATIDEGIGIAVDGSNNTYTTGYFTASLILDNQSLAASGLTDIYISKQRPDGSICWLKKAGGTDNEKPEAIAVDVNGNSVITGSFYGTVDFGGVILTSYGQQDIFTAKYDSAGLLIWAKQAGGILGDIGHDVTFDNTGNVIVTGEFSAQGIFGTFTTTSLNNSPDIFILKYNAAGVEQWVKTGNGKLADLGTAVECDVAGNIIVAGNFSDTVTFDQVHPNTMNNSIFMVSLNTNGQEQWFRWMSSGAGCSSGDLKIANNEIILAGNFSGVLYFYGNASVTNLTGTLSYNIFLSKFDVNGNLSWASKEGSANELNLTAITAKPNGNIIVGGNFKCLFNDYSSHYGDAIFNSIGYSDTYVASYSAAGAWQWSRQYGGKKNDFLNGLAIRNDSIVVSTGSFNDNYFLPYKTSSFTFSGTYAIDYMDYAGTVNSYCNDPEYNRNVNYLSNGNSDAYINSCIGEFRQPIDMFSRSGSGCSRTINYFCINTCVDSIVSCINVDLEFFHAGIYDYMVQPDFTFLWNTGVTTGTLTVATDGEYTVSFATDDGCLAYSDSVYFDKLPFQYKPFITDSKGINTNSPSPANIYLCAADTVTLFCPNVGSSTVQWSGFPQGMNPVVVSTPGMYTCELTNAAGCSDETAITIVLAAPINNIDPQILFYNNINDTITLCQNSVVDFLVYDNISNPGGANLTACIPDLQQVEYTITPFSPFYSFSPITFCAQQNHLAFFSPGIYTLVINVKVRQYTTCEFDSSFVTDTVTINVLPATNGTVNIYIAGPQNLCLGDTAMITVFPSYYNYTWSNGVNNDTLFVTQTGSYIVDASYSVINIYGCTDNYTALGVHTIADYPQPVISSSPVDGVICPNDSVQLLCSGSGSVTWYGPAGSFGAGINPVYITDPGDYYCVQEVATGCDYVSNTIQTYQYSSPAIYASPDSVCWNANSLITVVASASSTIQWMPPLTGTSASNYAPPGFYTVNVTECGITTPLSVYVNPYPINFPSITFNAPDLVASAGAAYQWYLNGFLIPGANSQSWLPLQNGTYSVLVTDVYGCVNQSPPFVVTTVSIEDISAGQIVILTDAAAGFVSVHLNSGYYKDGMAIITFTDLMGRNVITRKCGKHEEINIEALANGVYIVKVEGTQTIFKRKIIISR
jgi:hypothetical protein